MSLYTVFTLSDKDDPSKVRFVGLTSQTVAKRLGDIMAAAVRPGFRAYNTAVSEWLRSIDNRPILTVVFESAERHAAAERYRAIMNKHIFKGAILNSRAGRASGRIRTEPTYEKLAGRPVDKTSENAVKNLLTKQRKALKKQ